MGIFKNRNNVTEYGRPHTSHNEPKEHVTTRRFEGGKQVRNSADHHLKGSKDYEVGKSMWDVLKGK